MEQPGQPLTPVSEVIVRVYRRLLALVGGLGLFLAVVQLVPPADGAWLAASVPMGVFGLACLWARRALARPRPAAYWTTVIGFGGVVAVIVIAGLLAGDLLTPLFTIVVWWGPLRALALPRVRKALSGDDDPRGGLRRRIREIRERLQSALRPQLRPVPVPLG